jgi:RNA polymerase sigma-70 factor (ECF subfamily)
MALEKGSFAEFLERLQARDEEAAREMFRRFTHQLLALARAQFGAGLRHKVDPEDVVQSTYKSFFRRYNGGTLEAVDWNGLWSLLTLITVRKCRERVAYHRAECRDVAREVSATPTEDGSPGVETFTREPTPSEAAQLSETVDQLLADLDEDERSVVELSLRGYTTREISAQLGRAERTVRLLRESVRKRLERMQREGL